MRPPLKRPRTPFEKQFSRGEVPEEMPEIMVSSAALSISELLKTCFDITGGEAKRMVGQGAVALDGVKIDDPNQQIAPQEGMILKMGRRRWAKIKMG
jgi:tyrosyl-tRNA synthetase